MQRKSINPIQKTKWCMIRQLTMHIRLTKIKLLKTNPARPQLFHKKLKGQQLAGKFSEMQQITIFYKRIRTPSQKKTQ